MNSYAPLLQKYSRQATYYDRRWNLRWGEATLRAAVQAVPWGELRRVLDVGCGTGTLEQAVRPRLRPPLYVVGVDISFAMLEQARQKLNGRDRVGWTNAPAEHLPFARHSFDAVICNNSFHYYRQPLRVLEEFRRVLRPGGRLILVDWCNDFLVNKVSHWALRLAHHTGIHRYSLKQCYSTRELQDLLQLASFRIDSCRRQEIDWGWGVMVCRARA